MPLVDLDSLRGLSEERREAPVYLDNAASTRMHPRVLAAMLPWLTEQWANPSSVHRMGKIARRAVDEARERVAASVGVSPDEVVFTSGGTEANNLAVRGVPLQRGDRVITTSVEHPCVLESCKRLQRRGIDVVFVPVAGDGTLDPEAVAKAVNSKTALVSLMHVQNETGAVFPVDEVARRVKAIRPEALVHSDGVQAFGKLATPRPIDMYSISSHKVCGPKGVGALIVRRGTKLAPLLVGGGQERGLRSGTEPVPLIVGFGVAAELAARSLAPVGTPGMGCDRARIAYLSDMLRRGVSALGGIVNSPETAVPDIVNASFPGLSSREIVGFLDERGIMVSPGSACSCNKAGGSRVLTAMGLPPERSACCVRMSLGRETTTDDVRATLRALGEMPRR